MQQKNNSNRLAPYTRTIVKYVKMALTRHNTLFLLLIGLVLLGGCSYDKMVKMAKEQELVVNPSPLELHGDSVIFHVSATLPVGMLRKNRLYTIKTYYTYGDPTADFEVFEFSDTEFPNHKVEQPSITKKFSMGFVDEMETGELKIKGIASNLDKTKFKETPELKIADGVITTCKLVKPTHKVAYAPHGYNNQEELIPTRVVFNFDKGSSRLRSTETRGDAGQKLDAFIASKNATKTVTIYGSHSPEGLESINSKLAEERAEVIRKFYFKKMKDYDYKGMADSIKFEKVAIFQKWDEFIKLVNASDLSGSQKGEVLNITKSGESFEAQEKKLSKLSYYDKLTSDIYPQLRYSRTEILSIKPKKTDAEISLLATAISKGEANGDTLSYEELMYAATLTPLLDEKEKIYEAATKYHGSYQSHNNLGAVYMEKASKATSDVDKKGLISKAIAQFDLSINKESNPFALNNKGACQLISGKREECISTLGQASSADADLQKSINAGLGAAYIMKGDYTSAVSSLGASSDEIAGVTFNLGLAQLLSKDFESAEKSFESATYIDKQDAIAFYGAAIVQARKKNVDGVALQLKEAFAIDANLKEKALKDLEFLAYRENATFKAIFQ